MLRIDTLNDPQREAVLHAHGPLVVFAGAGSGKTRVITHRVAHLISEHHVPAYRILAVTFTNKAAGEMRERLAHLLGHSAQDLWVGTFHAICARLLRKYHAEIGIKRDFVIYDDSDQKAMLSRIVGELELDEKRYDPKKVAGAINRAKQEVQGPDLFPASDPWNEVVKKVYRVYEERMARAGALDFGDLIYRLVVALESNDALRQTITSRFDHVLVDEFQDTNRVQFRLVEILSSEKRNLCVVGDDDQSIYRWRGADRRNILDFRRTYPEATVVKLEQNYRSTQRILRAAHAVISRNFDREPKTLWTENEEGSQVLVVCSNDERDEARLAVETIREARHAGRAYADVAIFYRTHAQSRVLEEALRAANIAYRVVGGMRFYDRSEVKDVLAYLRVLANSDDDVSVLRVVNVPARGIGKTTVDRILEVASRQGISAWQALLNERETGSALAKKLAPFVDLITQFQKRVARGEGPAEIARGILDETKYRKGLREEDTAEADARLQNIEELLGSIDEFEAEAETPTLSAFLETVTLQTDTDKDKITDRVTLMTVHAAKGLEFPVVFVGGLEEQMFPYRGVEAGDDPDELEEERRLAYVAFTRAREKLILSWAPMRRIFGQPKILSRSRFLDELPKDDIQEIGKPSYQSPAYASSQSGWDDDYDRPARPSYPAQRSSYGSARPAFSGSRSATPAKPQRSSTESYVDLSEGDLAREGFREGMKVAHAKYGVGQVRSVSPGAPPKVTVTFPGWGTKQIIATFLSVA